MKSSSLHTQFLPARYAIFDDDSISPGFTKDGMIRWNKFKWDLNSELYLIPIFA